MTTRFARLHLTIACAAVVAATGHAQTHGVRQPSGTQAVEDRYTFRTLAGDAGIGSSDGTGSAARFFYPQGAAPAPDGSLYVADTTNHTIRKVTPAGQVSTFAGVAGETGSADGTGAAARFNKPQFPAIDRNGVLYVADANNHTIRRITPAGVVTTIAGQAGSAGSADGRGGDARFRYPEGTAVDTFGNVYVADTDNHTIRRIGADGTVSTVAGTAGNSGSQDGGGSSARFNFPSHLAVDPSGTIYVADTSNQTIRKIVGDVVTTIAGAAGQTGATNGTGSAARFNTPNGVAVTANGDVLVVDFNNNAIRKVAADGQVTTFAGRLGIFGSTDGPVASALFAGPSRGAGVDRDGTVYVGDTNNQTIRKITAAGIVSTLAGSPTTGRADGRGAAAKFTQVWGIAVDRSGNTFVSDYYNHAIRKVTPDGTVTTFAGSLGTAGNADGNGATARFRYPRHIAIGPADTLYVADSNNHTIRAITASGAVTTLAGLAGTSGNADGAASAARFNFPSGLAVDSAGVIYVGDGSNHTIRRITTTGDVSTIAGQAGQAGSADGSGAAARFNFPYAMAAGSDGSVYVADANNETIRKVSRSGIVTTLAGLAGVTGYADGSGANARFDLPAGLAVDAAGNVYVSDADNAVLRRITPSGDVTTIAGALNTLGAADGPASATRFVQPFGIAVDASGAVYVADRYGSNVRVGSPR